jgi:hypothetical protein
MGRPRLPRPITEEATRIVEARPKPQPKWSETVKKIEAKLNRPPTRHEYDVCRSLFDNPGQTANSLNSATGINFSTVMQIITSLRTLGVLVRDGAARTKHNRSAQHENKGERMQRPKWKLIPSLVAVA